MFAAIRLRSIMSMLSSPVFSSRVGRRMFGLLLLCAMLPILFVATVSLQIPSHSAESDPLAAAQQVHRHGVVPSGASQYSIQRWVLAPRLAQSHSLSSRHRCLKLAPAPARTAGTRSSSF